MIMNVRDLSREQLTELKQNYLEQLANEGTYSEVLSCDHNEPSYWDMINADEIVPDDVIFENYADICFVRDDFFCTAEV